MSATSYSRESVERALNIHCKDRWKHVDGETKKGRWAAGRYLVDTHNIGTVEFTLAQAFAFVVGCADATKRRPT